MAGLPNNGGENDNDGDGREAKRPRLSLFNSADGPFLINFDGLVDDDSSDSSYHPDKGELQEFQRECEAKVTKLIKTVRNSETAEEEFQKILCDHIQSTQPSDHDILTTEIRFAMANAIQYKKWNILEVLIAKCPPHLLPEVFSGSYPLLNFAVRIASVEAVKLLLKNGANCWNEFSSSSLETLLLALEDSFDYEYFTESTAKSFLEILRLLLQYGADPSVCPKLINQIAGIAGRSAELAALILAKAPTSSYFNLELKDGKQQPSTLFMAFESMNSWDPLNSLEMSFRHGIIPMLKFGAPLKPIDDMFISNLPPSQNLAALDKRCSRRLWKRPFAVIQLVIEARQTSSLKIGRIRKAMPSSESQASDGAIVVEENVDEDTDSDESSSDEMAEDFSQILQFLQSEFPRRLQAICRTAILNCLPMGPKRPECVKSLSEFIPPPLISFLLFEELDLPAAKFKEDC